MNNGENQLSGTQGLKITLSKFQSAKVMSVTPPKVEVAGEAFVNPFRVRTATVAVMSRSAATFTLRLTAVMLVTVSGQNR